VPGQLHRLGDRGRQAHDGLLPPCRGTAGVGACEHADKLVAAEARDQAVGDASDEAQRDHA
jgi:hypothetical protein